MSGKKGAPQIQDDVSPNLIPMIDIMFLLLLFFMLGADMGQRDLEVVQLPLADSIKEDKEKEDAAKGRLTINIHHEMPANTACAAYEASPREVCRQALHWKFAARGLDYTDPEKLADLLKKEADRDRLGAGASERRVMLRADEGAPYGYIQDVMDACARVGIYQIECGAARPSEQGAPKR